MLPKLSAHDGKSIVGWLDRREPFLQGSVSQALMDTLWRITGECQSEEDQSEGVYRCTFCGVQKIVYNGEWRELRGRSGFVAGFHFPELIFHYTDAHLYRPPDEFVRALGLEPTSAEFVTVETWATTPTVETEDPDVLLADLENRDRDLQDHAFENLTRRGMPPEAAPVLVRLLSHPNWSVRRRAVRALGALCNREHVPELVRAGCDESRWVREAAAQALGELCDAQAEAPLRKLLEDDCEPVCLAAQQALDRLGKA